MAKVLDNKEVLDKILSRIVPHLNGCWIYHGTFDEYGYARIRHRYKYWRVSRLIYKLTFPKLYKEELNTLHKCDNPACVNPEHLFQGTQADNIEDMISKGRHSIEGRAKAFLTEDQVREIRSLIKQGVKQIDIAKRFDVTDSIISNINKNRIHRNVI